MIDPSPVERGPLHLFEGYGIELEYMIVGDGTLDVLPVADRLLADKAGEITEEVEVGPYAWSNELVLHVVELKTNGPAPSLDGVASGFQQHVAEINERLRSLGGRLMPGAMHPWMNPDTDTRLWPHGYSEIYAAYDRIFSCRGHGWANLQSTHLNLPFATDDEFGRLHAAIRLLLPLLPAISASSPVTDGAVSGLMDTRLEVYRTNQQKIPSIAGLVIPEPLWTQQAYEGELLANVYADIAPHDPQGILQFEWLNSRGAIARFDRRTIEIRTIDIQEHPAADLAVVTAAVSVLQALVGEHWTTTAEQQAMATGPLSEHWRAAVRDADEAVVDDANYLRHFGLGPTARPVTMADIWRHLLDSLWPAGTDAEVVTARDTILDQGPLARRMVRALGPDPTRDHMATVWHRLCDCLAAGRPFRA